MSQFYAEIQGSRGLASRQGTKKSGIWCHIRGWHNGVSVVGDHDTERGDRFYVYITHGSRGEGSSRCVGHCEIQDGKVVWVPAE
jgi:hypothetical protein